jgi:acetyl-CoA carboxylase, biotin carboxylase subunit
MPSPGLIRSLRPASGPGIRDDGGVAAGYQVPVFYDSLIAKLIAWARTRDDAIARMARALREYQVVGLKTTIPFFLWLMQQPDYRSGRYDTTYLDSLLADAGGRCFAPLRPDEEEVAAVAAALDGFLRTSAGSPTVAAQNLWVQAARREALRE